METWSLIAKHTSAFNVLFILGRIREKTGLLLWREWLWWLGWWFRKLQMPRHIYVLAPPNRLVSELWRRSARQRHSGWNSADSQLHKSLSIATNDMDEKELRGKCSSRGPFRGGGTRKNSGVSVGVGAHLGGGGTRKNSGVSVGVGAHLGGGEGERRERTQGCVYEDDKVGGI